MSVSLVFADSFDHYSASQLAEKWTQAQFFSLVTGRNGLGCQLTGGAGQLFYTSLGNIAAEWVVGFALNFSGLAGGNTPILTATWSGNTGYTPFKLAIGQDSNIYILSGNEAVGWGNFPLYQGIWYYIETVWVVGLGSGGLATVSCVVRINGASSFSAGGQGNASAPIVGGGPQTGTDSIQFNAPNNSLGNCIIDDVYLGFPSAISTAGMYGDVKVIPYFPSSDVSGNQWSGSYTDIDSNPPSTSTDIASTTAGQRSYFGFQPITGSTAYLAGLTIPAVQSVAWGIAGSGTEKVDASIGSIATHVDEGPFGFNSAGDTFQVEPWMVEPLSGNPWTAALFNASFFGVYEDTT